MLDSLVRLELERGVSLVRFDGVAALEVAQEHRDEVVWRLWDKASGMGLGCGLRGLRLRVAQLET